MYIHTYLYIHILTYMHACIHTHIRTYIHTLSQTLWLYIWRTHTHISTHTHTHIFPTCTPPFHIAHTHTHIFPTCTPPFHIAYAHARSKAQQTHTHASRHTHQPYAWGHSTQPFRNTDCSPSCSAQDACMCLWRCDSNLLLRERGLRKYCHPRDHPDVLVCVFVSVCLPVCLCMCVCVYVKWSRLSEWAEWQKERESVCMYLRK